MEPTPVLSTISSAGLYLAYLLASISFILGLKMLSHPRTARRGNLWAAAGMGLAILATLAWYKTPEGLPLGNLGWIFSGLFIGTLGGTWMAKKVKMTAMPEMVSLFNGMGGACAMFISVIEFQHSHGTPILSPGMMTIILLGMIIGTISFTGSMIAWGKLNGRIGDRRIKSGQALNFTLLGGILAGSILLVAGATTSPAVFYSVLFLSALYGVLFVLPIGGADMPVVISLLNSFTGVAAAFGGFLYDNPVMLTGGILVGSAGTILTILMCRAMNRSLKNVLLGALGGGTPAQGGASESGRSHKEINLGDTAVLMAYSSRVMIIPGYGLAVAQAQHVCHELEEALQRRDVEVCYGIHPVAGRMPGHMNVLLAEADVPYEKLLELEEANRLMNTTGVVLILGANDVVNPAALETPSSPIYGMPVLEVEKAEHVIVNKRSMKPGYAGIDNDLFYRPKTSMLFGDAKKVLQNLVEELKNV